MGEEDKSREKELARAGDREGSQRKKTREMGEGKRGGDRSEMQRRGKKTEQRERHQDRGQPGYRESKT